MTADAFIDVIKGKLANGEDIHDDDIHTLLHIISECAGFIDEQFADDEEITPFLMFDL